MIVQQVIYPISRVSGNYHIEDEKIEEEFKKSLSYFQSTSTLQTVKNRDLSSYEVFSHLTRKI